MSDTYGDEPLKYLSQTPQRQRDEIHRLQGEVEALRRERDAEKEKARVLRVENNTVRMDLAAMTVERNEWKLLHDNQVDTALRIQTQLAAEQQSRSNGGSTP